MASSQDEDMYLFQTGLDQTPTAFAGQDFDAFLADSPDNGIGQSSSDGFMNPNDLTIKRESAESTLLGDGTLLRSSRSSASSSSSGNSARYENRNASKATTVSPAATSRQQAWGTGINGLTMPSADQFYDDATMGGLDGDLDASNQQMASAFDFETAASTPSGYDAAPLVTMKPSSAQTYRRTLANFGPGKTASPRLPAGGQSQFYLGSREASPLSAMLPQNQVTSPWTKHSPSSGLEETFNHITMNADSPGNATFSPNMQFATNGFTFDAEPSATPSTFTKDIASPPSTITAGDSTAHLTIYPTSLKSRVETQIPIKMVLFPLPAGAKKLRLPTHTVSKPKFLAKPEVDRSPEVLELHTSLVCTSAMQDPARLERALARARGEDLSAYSKPSPASSTGSQTSSKDDEDKPLNGGEVKICAGCIQRERKRASRKKQKKPEEEELFQKDEEKRVVVFNTSEIKDWVETSKDHPSSEHASAPPPGAMQVELPMRIACYCRHQNEKMGFQVIFTIKDFRDKIIAQAMTNSIMITDDHKTHNVPPQVQTSQSQQLSNAPQLPGAGVFSTSGLENHNTHPNSAKLFKQSFSTTDLQNLQHNFNPNFPMAPTNNPFAITGSMSASGPGSLTPRVLSRPASPSGPSGPTSKRRKQSGSGKLPSGLTMTRLDTAPTGAATMPNTAASSPYATNMQSYMSPTDRFNLPPGRAPPYGTSPPTPNGNDSFAIGVNRSFSLDNLPRQALMSAPSSRQPSRPNSPRPHSSRNSFGQNDANFGQAVNNSLISQTSRRPPPIIHKLVPAEGSVTGGTEVTLLGNGFYQGLEVMFGDTEATTTTFWGEKCLNCIAPPALQAGVVAVVFKHEHPQYAAVAPQSQTRHSVFTYTDDREVEMLRLALRTIGKQMQHPTDDPFTAAQQLLQQNQQQQQQTGMWPQHGGYAMGGSHQRQATSISMQQQGLLKLESSMLNMLQYARRLSKTRAVSLDLQRPGGLTLLHLASSLGLTRFVTALLLAGARPNVLDGCGHAPMHHAAMHGHEHVIQRLRMAGADHRIRSFRSFTPADLATTLAAYQAALQPRQLRYAKSTDGERHSHTHAANAISLQDSWEYSSDDYESDSDAVEDDVEPLAQPPALSSNYVVSAQSDRSGLVSQLASRRGSSQFGNSQMTFDTQPVPQTDQLVSPGALLQAWRQLLNLTHMQQQQLADHIQHFQASMPHLPTIPQDNPVVRRMSALLPHRTQILGQQIVNRNEDNWSGSVPSSSTAPPAYDELFPSPSNHPSAMDIKKTSVVQAAADAAADLHFETREIQQATITSKKNSSMANSMRPAIQRVALAHDLRMFFFWIPIALAFLGIWLHSFGVLKTLSIMADYFPAISNQAANAEGVDSYLCGLDSFGLYTSFTRLSFSLASRSWRNTRRIWGRFGEVDNHVHHSVHNHLLLFVGRKQISLLPERRKVIMMDGENQVRYEEQHVHQVYDQIASHFSSTRFKPWPVVDRFLNSLRKGAVGLDIGCGNGKYLTVRKDIFIVASDRSSELLKFAAQHQPHSAIVADTLLLPHPDFAFDFAICIAVIHHLSTSERRRDGIRSILQTLRPGKSSSQPSSRPGQALIFVWALEQKNSRRGWDEGMEQDVLVPWVLKSERVGAKLKLTRREKNVAFDASIGPDDDTSPSKTSEKTFHRYYHLYRDGELREDIVAAGGRIVEEGYDRDNWWAICERQ